MAVETHGNELTDDQIQMLASVLDTIIPPTEDGSFPGAGEIGLAEILNQKAPELVPVLVAGLAVLAELMASREETDFMTLENAKRRSLLEEVADQLPIFLPGLLFQTYSNYYQHPRVLEALGLAARAPYPLGHDLEPGDMGLLDPVRRRAPLYRDC